jgi:hypothetical protein
LCGKLFKSVGRHIQHSHDLTIEEYKELIGLNKFTPLVCENTSMKMRENYQLLSNEEKELMSIQLQNLLIAKANLELILQTGNQIFKSSISK